MTRSFFLILIFFSLMPTAAIGRSEEQVSKQKTTDGIIPFFDRNACLWTVSVDEDIPSLSKTLTREGTHFCRSASRNEVPKLHKPTFAFKKPLLQDTPIHEPGTSKGPGSVTHTPIRKEIIKREFKDVWRPSCDASWDSTCGGDARLDAPPSWKICRYSIVVDSISHGEWRLNYANKKQISVHLHSWGSRAPFDRWSGWVILRMSELTLVPEITSDEDWVSSGCTLANGGGSLGSPGTEELRCVPTGPNMGVQLCRDYIYEGGQRKYSAPYQCGVCITN